MGSNPKISVGRTSLIVTRRRGAGVEYRSSSPGISVYTATNKAGYMDNIFANYLQQNHPAKELLIIINNNDINLEDYKARAAPYPDIRVYRLDQSTTLGECMNFAIEHAQYDYAANFDDDDYYAPNYLRNMAAVIKDTRADIIGKGSHYVFFESTDTLAIAHPDRQNRWIQELAGATLVIKKDVLRRVRFPHIDNGADSIFTRECWNRGLRMYSTDRLDYVYIRRHNPASHTWYIEDNEYLKCCSIVRQTGDYKSHING
jgi:glycosyltransferase involved in cell wall biosynthesis